MVCLDVDEREAASFDDSRILSAIRREVLNEFVLIS